MEPITDPLELLKYIQTIFPDVEYLACDKDGECYAFRDVPMIGNLAWIVIVGNTSSFFVSEKLSNVLVWKSKNWKERVVTTV